MSGCGGYLALVDVLERDIPFDLAIYLDSDSVTHWAVTEQKLRSVCILRQLLLHTADACIPFYRDYTLNYSTTLQL